MGFFPGQTRRTHKGRREGLQGRDSHSEDTVRCAQIGKSFHTTAAATILGSLIADAGWPQAYASPATLVDRFALDIEEYKRTGGPRIVDELVDFTALIIE